MKATNVFSLPVEKYIKEREKQSSNSLRLLGLYSTNSDLMPSVIGLWTKQYYEYKLLTQRGPNALT